MQSDACVVAIKNPKSNLKQKTIKLTLLQTAKGNSKDLHSSSNKTFNKSKKYI